MIKTPDTESYRALSLQKHQPSIRGLLASDRNFLFICIGLLVAIRLALSFWLPFTDSTEARYAEIARKMLETGDWITPQFDYGIPFWGKPPLHTWLSALGMQAFGVGPFGARFLIFVSTLAVLGIIYTWVRAIRGLSVALVSVTICASSPLFFGASAFVMTDMVMVLGITLSMVSFHRAITSPKPSSVWGHLFFVGLAMGMLTKGPTAVVLTGIPIFLWLLAGWRWHRLANLPWVSGIAIALLLTVPWYAIAEAKTPGFLQYFFVGEHIDRFLVPGWKGDLYGSGHAQPKGMIWLFGIAVFLPWTVFTTAFVFRLRKVQKTIAGDNFGWFSYLGFWTLSPLLLFTPAANILPAYTLPAIPAMSILLAALWSDVFSFDGRWTRRTFQIMMVGLIGVFITLTGVVKISPNSLSIKSMDSLVTQLKTIAPNAQVVTFPKRSYSAEFYTRGAARSLTDAAQLKTLLDNGTRDAVLVPRKHIEKALAQLGPAFSKTTQTKRYALLLEKAICCATRVGQKQPISARSPHS